MIAPFATQSKGERIERLATIQAGPQNLRSTPLRKSSETAAIDGERRLTARHSLSQSQQLGQLIFLSLSEEMESEVIVLGTHPSPALTS
mgnify:CR=1